MTIRTDRWVGKVFVCDECGAELETDSQDCRVAWPQAARAGWELTKGPRGEFVHFCSDCCRRSE